MSFIHYLAPAYLLSVSLLFALAGSNLQSRLFGLIGIVMSVADLSAHIGAF